MLEERIGLGGMGEVYRARHLELNTTVAVKLLSGRLQGQEAALRRFRREARSAARLRSTHIVQVFDFGVDGGTPFLVMELLQGESLGARAGREGRFDLRTVGSWLEQAAEGLAVAHANGVVHRDVKPNNLFLATDGTREILKILDFGVAKPQEEDDDDGALTGERVLVGSPLYMSPEQASGAPVDARTDVWALGAVAFRLVTGQDAFAAPTTREVLATIRAGSPRTATRVVPSLPAELDAFFERALAWNPEQRFRSVEELAAAFPRMSVGVEAAPIVERSAARSSTTQSFLSADLPPERVAAAPRRSLAGARSVLLGVVLAVAAAWVFWAGKGPEEPQRAVESAESMAAVAPEHPADPPRLTSLTPTSLSMPSAWPRPADASATLGAGAQGAPRRSLAAPASSSQKPRARRLSPPIASTRAPEPDPLFGL